MHFELPSFIDSLPGLAWTAFPDGRAELLNQRWLEYTGLREDQAVDRGWIDAIHPDDRERVGNYWHSCVVSGRPGDTEARMRRHDGAYRWFLFRANPARDAQGNITRWFGTNIDIEDRKRSEEALQANDRNLRLIIDSIPAGLYVLNPAGTILQVNKTVTDYTGLRLEDLQQENYREHVIHPDDLKRITPARTASLKVPAPFENEQRVLAKDGQYRWFHVRYSPLLNEQGQIVRWFVAAFDIEDRKRAVEQTQLLASMMQCIPAAVWSVTPDGTPDIVNQGWYEYTGQTPEYVRSHPNAWMSTMHPDDGEAAGKVYSEGIRAGIGFTMEARFLRASDRTYRWHLNRAVPVHDLSGNITRFVGTSTDIEDLKAAQEELHDTRATLAHAARLMTMGELTASIAHEINQPLAGIITNASTCLRMLAAEEPNVDGARETARRTIRDANRASEVITHLRAMFAKKEAAAEPVDLNEAMLEVLALCTSDVQRKGAVIRAELAGDLPIVIGDRIQLQQVILNLLTNAADAMLAVDDRPREICVQTGLDADGLVRVTVRDSGAGIDCVDADKIFKPFISTKPQGMGIGLSVSRSIIENHHGRIWAVKNEGPGATFVFVIPQSPMVEKCAASAVTM